MTADGAIAGIEVEETDGALTRFTFTGETANAPVARGDLPLHAARGSAGGGCVAAGVVPCPLWFSRESIPAAS